MRRALKEPLSHARRSAGRQAPRLPLAYAQRECQARAASVFGSILMPYAHPEALVTTEWLAAHRDDPDLRLLDASFTLPGVTPTARENYAREHIPGAVFFDIDDIAEPGTELPHMVPRPSLFAHMLWALGVVYGYRVVVYDITWFSSSVRALCMLRLFVLSRVAV